MGVIEIMKVKIQNLSKDPENPRLAIDKEFVSALAKSYKALQKFLEPPRIRDNTKEKEKFWVWEGWHRVLAAKKLGLKELDCEYTNLTDAEVHRELATNEVIRKELNIWERGKLYSEIIKDEGISETELARKYAFSQPYVSQNIKVYEAFPIEKACLVKFDDHTDRIWREIASLPEKKRDTVLADIQDSNIKDKDIFLMIVESERIENLLLGQKEEVKQKFEEEFGDKLYTYQVPSVQRAIHRMEELRGDSHRLTKMIIQIEKGDEEDTWDEMTKFCQKYSGVLVGKYWEIEIDKEAYDEEQEKLEWEELKQKEKERKEREKDKKE
jgi:ParB/RepB/Spo0J family partition protein